MCGLIDNKQALSHLCLIWREFGAKCAVRCVGAVLTRKRETTFLNLVFTDTHSKAETRADESMAS